MALHCSDPAASSLFFSNINTSQLHSRFHHNPSPSSLGVRPQCIHTKRRKRLRRFLTHFAASSDPESRAENDRKEIQLNSLDLMALEFGRLLGESKEKTVSKVVRKKIDPGATYIGIEKQVKGEKTSILKQVTIQSPKKAPRNSVIKGNDITSTSSLPALSSPPTRQKVDFPQKLTRPELKLGEEEIVDDALLRRPLGQGPSKKSQGEGRSISGQNESMEMSKIRFQRLLQESFDTNLMDGSSTSSTSSLPDLSLKSASNKKEFRVKISPPGRPQLVSEEVFNMERRRTQENVVPNLASPPSRQKGSAGMFSTTLRPGSRTLTEIPPLDEDVDDSLLRKPTLSQPQAATIALETGSSSDMSTDVVINVKKSKLVEDELNEFPSLASSPSRQKGSAGMFSTSSRVKARTPITIPVDDNAANDSSIQKPSLSEPQQYPVPSETNSSYRLSSNKTKDALDEASINDGQVQMPTDVDIVINKPNESDFSKSVLPVAQTGRVPTLASPPSRQKGSAGIFSTSPGARSSTETKNPAVEKVDDSFLRKPTLSQSAMQPSNNTKNSELKEGNVNHDEVLHEETGVDDNEQGNKLDEEYSHESQILNKTILDEVEESVQNESMVMFDEKSQQIDTGDSGADEEKKSLAESSFFGMNLPSENETSVQVTLMKPKLPQPSQVGIKSTNLGLIPDIGDVKPRSIGSLNEEVDFRQSTFTNVDPMVSNKMELKMDMESSLSQVDEPFVYVQMSSATELRELTSGNDGNKQELENGVSRNKLSTETGSASPKQFSVSTEILRKPLQVTNPQLSKQKDKEILRLLAKQEDEDKEWARAHTLLKSKEQVDVKLIGSNSAGLFASFGCLVGFLPSFELSQKRGLIDFSTWAQRKGINLRRKAQSLGSSVTDIEASQNEVVMEGDLRELRRMYNEEILKLISTFIGETVKVIVKQVDKGTRRLKFSEKETDPDSRGLIQKKAELMGELKVGDVVTCEVKSITPIGVFVEMEGVAALIHHSEVSWNKNVDASSLLSIGEIIKAKVCRLDRNLQRISLSLKQMQPDPLTLTLESVVGDAESDALRDLEATESEASVWPELEDLVKELQKAEQISSVSKGRCLRSTALAPTFQVFLSAPQSDGYKLLARFGNEIQEVVVKTTLDREKMKECIRLCTFTSS